jgi:hypothetical protein
MYRSLTFLLALTLIWTFSLRPVRHKIGDTYFLKDNFDRAIIWYGKVVKKEKFMIDSGIGHFITPTPFEKDLSKLQVAEVSKLRSSFIHKRFRSQGMDRPFKCGSNRLNLAKERLSDLTNIYNYFGYISSQSTHSNILGFIASKHHFINGAIDEIEGNFLGADANYEMAAISLEENYLTHIRATQNEILPCAADQYLNLTSSIKLIGSPNVSIGSINPLLINGVKPGMDNYLEYEKCFLKYLKEKYPLPRLRIQGKVIGFNSKSCIVPRVVFWGGKGYLGETEFKYPVIGKFDICFSFPIPDGTIEITPRITFDASCFLENQKILFNDTRWY